DAAVVVAEPDAAIVAAVADAATTTDIDLKARCTSAKTKREWAELERCGRALGGHDGAAFVDLAVAEAKAQTELAAIKQSRDDIELARAHLAKIPATSVYRAAAEKLVADRSRPPVTTSAPPCDADALRKQGEDAVNVGQMAVALVKFEQSLACKPDPLVQ